MKLLTARRIGSDFRYVVHLDETKWVTIPDPDNEGQTKTVPDPAWVLDRTYGAGPRLAGETATRYRDRLTAFEAAARVEMRALSAEALAAAQARESGTEAGTALEGEGAAL